MFKSRDCEKRINASIYLAASVPSGDRVRLGKLLYLLDFEHFRQTGHSVTGLDYLAMKTGPMPALLLEAQDSWAGDIAPTFDGVAEPPGGYGEGRVLPQREFDPSHFTRRELRIMEALRKRFPSEMAQLLDDVTDEERQPWEVTWDNGRGDLARIPYALAIRPDDPHAEVVREAAAEYAGMRLAQGGQP